MDWKVKRCDDFCEMLKGFRINFERHSVYHVQIMIQHNFYPSKETYYNSESGVKMRYPQFKNANEVHEFLSENVT